jgi:AsmA-like C-terminal region/AsmA family
MKKLLRILAITFGVILLLLILTPMFFRSKIESVVKEKVNEQIHATVDWSRFSLSLLRGFPDLSINLHQVSVVGVESFAGDTLAGLQRFELRVNPFSAIKKNLVVKSILVDSPLINGIVLEDGTANWDITGETVVEEEAYEEEPAEGSGSSMTLSLKRFAITGGRIYYLDHSTHMDVSLEGFNLELAGDFSMEQSELKLSTGIDRINARMGGIRYLRDGVFSLDLLAAANMVEQRYILKENLIRLNGLSLGAEGEVRMLDGGAMEMDLKFFSRETSFQTLLSLVPAVYLQDFESLEASGNMQLDGTVKGTLIDSILPDATLNLQVKDGYFAYPDLPKDVSDVQISLNVDYKGTHMDDTRVNLEQFHLLLGGNPFDLRMEVDHPISDMHVEGSAEGIIDFATLQDVIPMEDVRLSGRLETDMSWDALMSHIEKEQYEDVDLYGSLVIEGMELEMPDIPVPLVLEKMHMIFNPRKVELASLDMRMGSSDLHMDGDLLNFIPYVFKDQTISGSLNVSSSLLNVNELFPADESGDFSEMVSDTLVPVPPDSLAEPTRVRIPENIDFTMTMDMKLVEYDKIQLENIHGKMRVMEGVAGLNQLSMDIIEGSVTTSGWVDTRGEFAEAELNLDIEGVDIPAAYETFMSVEKLVPMAKYCSGSANIDMVYHSLLDASFSPLYESINARGRIYTKDLQLENVESFERLSEKLKNDKFKKIVPDEVDLGFTIRDGRILVDPFHINFENSQIRVAGSHGIDLSMDYKLDMNLAKADLGEGANEMMKGMTALAAAGGLKIPESDYLKVIAKITGTFNNPKVATDLSGNLKSAKETVKAAVEEKVTEEVEKVEEEVREKASEKSEKIISDAEKEAARLIEEAREAGEKLVKEAEVQGEKLIKEAGSNPLKQVAAKTAATELVRQAEKQSDNLVKEAEIKAEEIILKAREEAESI